MTRRNSEQNSKTIADVGRRAAKPRTEKNKAGRGKAGGAQELAAPLKRSGRRAPAGREAGGRQSPPPPFEGFLRRELWRAYRQARKGKRRTFDEHEFEVFAARNLYYLREAIETRYYRPSRGVAFMVHDPVDREIIAAPFRDRVVHHFIYNMCMPWWDRRFDYDSYSCRKGKGTHFGVKRLSHHMRVVSNDFKTEAYVFKGDLQGFFMSIDHQLLYEQALFGLERQFYGGKGTDLDNGVTCRPEDRDRLYQTLKFLWQQVIFDNPIAGITVRGKKSEWARLPRNKSLFHQPSWRGLVIGNLTSQLLSNIFLDRLDRFVRFDLGYRHYGRYVDDFYLVVPAERKAQLLRDVRVIEEFLRSEMKLTLHPKKRSLQSVRHGIPFLGFVVYPGHIEPGRRIKRNFYRAAEALAATGRGDFAGLISRQGMLRPFNHRKFCKKLYDNFGWEYDWLSPAEMREKIVKQRAGRQPLPAPAALTAPAHG